MCLKDLQTPCELDRTHGFLVADSFQRVLIDPPAPKFPLRNFCDLRQLSICGNRIALALVLNRFELQQAQVFALLPVPVGFLPDVDRRPIRGDMRMLQ